MKTFYVSLVGGEQPKWRTFLDCGNNGLTGSQRHIRPMESTELPNYWHENLNVVLATIVANNHSPITIVIE